jgi:putative transposase
MDGAGSHHGLVFPLCRQLGLREELKDPFVLVAVQEAMEKARPEIAPRPGKSVHQPGLHQVPRGGGVRISISPHHLQSLKYEEVYLNEYQSPREARQGISRYLTFYNHHRPHQSLKYRTPAEVYYGKG